MEGMMNIGHLDLSERGDLLRSVAEVLEDAAEHAEDPNDELSVMTLAIAVWYMDKLWPRVDKEAFTGAVRLNMEQMIRYLEEVKDGQG